MTNKNSNSVFAGPRACLCGAVARLCSFPNHFILSTEACEEFVVLLGSWQRAESYARDIIQVSFFGHSLLLMLSHLLVSNCNLLIININEMIFVVCMCSFPDYFILATEACQGSKSTSRGVYLGSWSRAESYVHDIITVSACSLCPFARLSLSGNKFHCISGIHFLAGLLISDACDDRMMGNFLCKIFFGNFGVAKITWYKYFFSQTIKAMSGSFTWQLCSISQKLKCLTDL